MRVKTNTPELLIIDDQPVLVAIMLLGFIFIFCAIGLGMAATGEMFGLIFFAAGIVIGGGAFYAFVRRVQVVFHRPEGWVEIRRKNLLAASKVRYALTELSHAALESSRSGNGTAMNRVVLRIPNGESAGWHPVTFAYSSGPGHRRCKDAINTWLGVTQ